jgi:hypothetical protein
MLQERQAGDGWNLGGLVVKATTPRSAVLTTFAGDRINRTLARALAIRGVGSVSADYAAVRVRAPKDAETSLLEDVQEVVAELRGGVLSDPRQLSATLEREQPLWPFSPFARCLPPPLWAAALVEQSLDAEGLIRWLDSEERSA